MPQLVSFGREKFLDLFEKRGELVLECLDLRIFVALRRCAAGIEKRAGLRADDTDLRETICFLEGLHRCLCRRAEVHRRRGNFQESFRDKNLLQFFYVSAGHA